MNLGTLIITIFMLNFLFLTNGLYKLNNLKCIEYDKSFATIPICKLKMVKRNVVALDLHVKLHQIPVNNVSVSENYKSFNTLNRL